MGKYFILFKNSISESLVYRTSVFLTFVSQFVSTVVFVILWSAIYSEGGKIGDYTLFELVQYFIFVGVINFAIQGIDVSWRVADDIRVGSVTNYILKPISYFRSILSITFGKSCFNLLVILLVIAPIVIFGGYFDSLVLGTMKILAVAVSLVISFLVFATYSYIVGLYAFWGGDGRGFNYIGRLTMNFFSGAIIPLDLLPDSIIKVSDWLPWKSIAWIPISLLTGRVEISPSVLLPGVLWAAVLMVLAYIIYNQALKRYEGLGA